MVKPTVLFADILDIDDEQILDLRAHQDLCDFEEYIKPLFGEYKFKIAGFKNSNDEIIKLRSILISYYSYIELHFFSFIWFLCGAKKPNKAQQKLMRENVTFVFKSFERQRLAKHLYKNIQRYYPGINVIIVDDSSKPLELTGPGLRVVQLPFNSGLSKGLNKGLELVPR